MRNSLIRVAALALLALSLSVLDNDYLAAQAPTGGAVAVTPPVPLEPREDIVMSLTPLRVDIVIQRFSSDNKPTGRMPFTLYARADERPVSLRLGLRVPIRTGQGVTYEAIGTNIDFIGAMTRDGRYRASITLTDRSPVESISKAAPLQDVGLVREYVTSNFVVLRDGQMSEFSVGTDQITGETTKAQITITAIK